MTTRKPARKAAPDDERKPEETAVAPESETAVTPEPETAVADSKPSPPPKAPRAEQSKAVVAATDKVWVKVVGSAPAVIAGTRLLPGEAAQVLYASYQQAKSAYGKALAVRYADSGPYSVE